MQIKEIKSQSILTRAGGYLSKVATHSLNPYAGCGFGRSSCGTYCYVQFNPWIVKDRTWGKFVDVKINADRIYNQTVKSERNWAHKQNKLFSVFLSSSTDPWQPVERKYRITRNILNAMLKEPPDSLILQTHTDRIIDDMSLIRDLDSLCKMRVHISVEGDRERLPGMPPPPCSLDKRLEALALFSKIGLTAIACLSPLYPLKEPEMFFQRLADDGVSAVIIDHFISGDGSNDGKRTFKTILPNAMAVLDEESIQLSYRDKIAGIAGKYLRVGLSSEGFAGNFSKRPMGNL